jgi:hypothetical protein
MGLDKGGKGFIWPAEISAGNVLDRLRCRVLVGGAEGHVARGVGGKVRAHRPIQAQQSRIPSQRQPSRLRRRLCARTRVANEQSGVWRKEKRKSGVRVPAAPNAASVCVKGCRARPNNDNITTTTTTTTTTITTTTTATNNSNNTKTSTEARAGSEAVRQAPGLRGT